MPASPHQLLIRFSRRPPPAATKEMPPSHNPLTATAYASLSPAGHSRLLLAPGLPPASDCKSKTAITRNVKLVTELRRPVLGHACETHGMMPSTCSTSKTRKGDECKPFPCCPVSSVQHAGPCTEYPLPQRVSARPPRRGIGQRLKMLVASRTTVRSMPQSSAETACSLRPPPLSAVDVLLDVAVLYDSPEAEGRWGLSMRATRKRRGEEKRLCGMALRLATVGYRPCVVQR